MRAQEASLSGRDRRALSIGVVVVAGGVLIGHGLPALRAWSDASIASAREAVVEVHRAELSVWGASALTDTMKARTARFLALAPALIDGTSAATAGATLASLFSGAAATADAKLASVQVRADDSARDSSRTRTFPRVSIRASLTADVRGLAKLLVALERGPTLLNIEELAVTQPEPGADGSRPEVLQVELVIGGLALAPGDRAP
jgi:hypothetical protein